MVGADEAIVGADVAMVVEGADAGPERTLGVVELPAEVTGVDVDGPGLTVGAVAPAAWVDRASPRMRRPTGRRASTLQEALRRLMRTGDVGIIGDDRRRPRARSRTAMSTLR